MIKKILSICLLAGVVLSPSISPGCDDVPTYQYGLFGVISDIVMTPAHVASELFVGEGTGYMKPMTCPCPARTGKPVGKMAYFQVQTYYCPGQRCFVVCGPVSVPRKPMTKKTQPTATAPPIPTQQPRPPEAMPVRSSKETVAKPQPLEPQPVTQPAKEPVALAPASQPRQAEAVPVPLPAPAVPKGSYGTAEPAASAKVQVPPEAERTAPLQPSKIVPSPSATPPEKKLTPPTKPSKTKPQPQAPCGAYYPPSGCSPMQYFCR